MKHIALFLRDIYFNKKSGRLVFKADDIEKYFFFREGNLLQIKTNQPAERLGEVLFKLEKINRDAHARIDDYIEPNTNIGEVLKTKGIITEQDLDDALVYQLRETTLNTFPYFDADLVFQERSGFIVESKGHRISVPFLIEYGIRRTPYHPALKSFMAKKTPVAGRQTLAYLLTEDEKAILIAIDGKVPAERLVASEKVAVDFFWKTLYLLYCLDLVDLKSPEGAPRQDYEKPADDRPVPREPGAPVPGAEDPSSSQLADVNAMHDSLSERNYYQILGVPRNAAEDEIKKAYFGLARRFHPDRFDRKALEANRERIDSIFDAITNAYKTLINREKRRVYDAGTGTTRSEDAQDIVKKADIKFRQGKTLFVQDRFDDAVTLLEEAVRLRKDKGDYYLLLAMAESKVPSYSMKAEEDFLKAISLEPWNPEGYVGLGFLYKNEGLMTKATRQFQKALDADPEHKLARQEVDLAEKGTRKKGLKGLLSMDIFGSKKKK
jgi:hypothetical protein